MRKLFILLSLVITFASCRKESVAERTAQEDGYFFNINIAGEQLSETNQMRFGFFSYTEEIGCIPNKRYAFTNITQFSNSRFFVDANLWHFRNNVDFITTTVGSKTMLNERNSRLCSLDLMITYEDEISNLMYFPTSQKPITANITSITKVSETQTTVKYNIEGNFSAEFRVPVTNSPRNIPISGSFRTWINVYK